MNILSDLKNTLEETTLQPIEISISEKELVKIAITLIITFAVIAVSQAFIKTITK